MNPTPAPAIHTLSLHDALPICEHLQFVEAGATLDHTEFPTGFNEVGALVARNEATGKFEPFTAVEGYDDFGILNEDFRNDYEQDLIAGEVIVRGSVYEDKLA